MKLIKKITGYILIVLSIILTIAFIGQIARVFQEVSNLLTALPSLSFNYELVRVFGWVIHFTLIVVLWKYGKKISRRTPYVANTDEQLLGKFGKEDEASESSSE